MIRNLNALGLTLVAVLAMSAVVASASQARNLTTETGNYQRRPENAARIHG